MWTHSTHVWDPGLATYWGVWSDPLIFWIPSTCNSPHVVRIWYRVPCELECLWLILVPRAELSLCDYKLTSYPYLQDTFVISFESFNRNKWSRSQYTGWPMNHILPSSERSAACHVFRLKKHRYNPSSMYLYKAPFTEFLAFSIIHMY